jgi:hypothetical protein
MAITLYDATVPVLLQGVAAVRLCLDKAAEHAETAGYDPESLAEARLIEDMFPLCLQIRLVAHHSAGALRDVEAGAFTLPTRDPLTFAEMRQLAADTEAALRGWRPEAVNGLADRTVALKIGGALETTFSGEAYFLAFALPNFNFHAVTAYDILRARGVPVGKRDWLGQLRTSL